MMPVVIIMMIATKTRKEYFAKQLPISDYEGLTAASVHTHLD